MLPLLPELKAKLRDEAFGRRDGLDPVWRAQASLAMAERALTVPELMDREPISAFWPILSEIDVKLLLEALARARAGASACRSWQNQP